MPETFRSIVEEFRQKILAKDVEAVLLILNEYSEVMVRVRRRLDILLKQIERLRAQNKIVSEYDIYRQIRYQEFLFQLRKEMVNYSEHVAEVVSKVQKEAIEIAFKQTDALFDFIYQDLPSGMLESFSRFDEFSARNIVAKLNDEKYLKSLTSKYESFALQSIKEVLIEGVITGRSVNDVKRDLIRKFDFIPSNAETIARTEINTAYREGNLERYRLSTTVKAWEWSATLDSRTCPVCIALDGQQFSLSTPFATHPNCRCSPIPVTFTFEELGLGYLNLKEPRPPYMGKRGEEWFRDQTASLQEKILGKTKYNLYKSGQISLEDLVQSYTHPVYGPSRQERSLKNLKSLRIIDR